MKDMHKVFGVLLPCLLILASGCVKEKSFEEKYRPAGTPIKFSATSEYENGDDTRTEYSGVLFSETVNSTTKSYERIDWVEDDPMTILYVNGSANPSSATYKINSDVHHNNTKESMATISANPSGSDLVWGESVGHTFYAMYPSTGYNNSGASLSKTDGYFRVQGTIPATQLTTKKTVNSTDKYLPNMDNGFMVAYANIPSGSTQTTVTLPFTPAVTTFEFMFKLKTSDDSYQIKEFRLKSGTSYPLTGTFAFNITGGDANGATWNKTKTSDYTGTNITNPGNTITVTFDTDGNGTADNVTMSHGSVFDFTVFALPIQLSELTMEIVYTNNVVKSLDLKQTINGTTTWATFEATKKSRITNYVVPNEQGAWTYTIETINDYSTTGHSAVSYPVSIKSYKTSAKNPSTKVAVPWKVQYSTYNGSSWSSWADVPSNGQITGGYTFSSGVTGDGGSSGESRTSGMTANSSYNAENLRTKDINEMKARTPFASSSGSAFDLSRHPCYGILGSSAPTQTAQKTANCYVVSRPGWYKFPCVYGNAIKGENTTNYDAFDLENANASSNVRNTIRDFVTNNYPNINMLAHFRNALNEEITSPYIVTDVSATSPSAKIVWQDYDIVTENSNNLYYSNGWIYFNVTQAKIQPGNVVIALVGDAGSYTNTILWSWHIWVTNKDLTPQTIGGKSMMDYNLGWMDTADVEERTYTNRTIKYRIIQTETNGSNPAVYEDFEVSQTGDIVFNKANPGTNPYYQWGRKDPIISSSGSVVSGNSYSSQTTSSPRKYNYRALNLHTTADKSTYGRIFEGLESGASGGYWTDADYGYGIRQPYEPISNSYTTGWVVGPVIPHRIYNSMYTIPNNPAFANTYFTDVALLSLPTGTAPNWISSATIQQCLPNGYNIRDFAYGSVVWYYYNASGNLVNGPWLDSDASGFISLGLDMRPQLIDDLESERKENSGVCSNLWNSVCYQATTSNETLGTYKTIYDPCPPGFMVPAFGVFDNFGTSDQHKLSGVNTADGVTFSGHFFPFTGARVWEVSSTDSSEPYHWSHTISLSLEDNGSKGFLWCNEHCAVVAGSGNLNRDNHYTDFQYGRLWSFDTGTATTSFYTSGTAASIRPVADPHF